jgi:hypothetical protein
MRFCAGKEKQATGNEQEILIFHACCILKRFANIYEIIQLRTDI